MSQPIPEAEIADFAQETLKDFKKKYGEDAKELFGSDWAEGIEAVINCDHICSGNCRRVGCNCACGEWHIPLIA